MGAFLQSRLNLNYVFWWSLFVFGCLVNGHLLEGEIYADDMERCIGVAVAALHLVVALLPLAALDSLLITWRKSVRSVVAIMSAMMFPVFYADCLLYRNQSLHLSSATKVIFQNGFSEGLMMFKVMGLPQTIWVTVGIVGFAMTIVLWGLYQLSWKISTRYSLQVVTGRLAAVWTVLALLGLTVKPMTERWFPVSEFWSRQAQVVPIYFGLPKNGQNGLAIRAELRPIAGAHIVQKAAFSEPNTLIVRKSSPDIFIFIIESLRSDVVDEVTTPHLFRLKKDSLPIEHSFSAGNATHLSLFSLLTARHPLYFGIVRRNTNLWGSVPIQIFRDIGYEIHALSGSYLQYYKVDEMSFGEKRSLLSSVIDADSLLQPSSAERDLSITRHLSRKIGEKAGGRLFLVFYDSSHQKYTWAKNFTPRFTPYSEGWNFHQALTGEIRIDLIKNRYRNSVAYVDSLIGSVISQLKSEGRYDNSVIFVTGDHGEEFLEHGKIMHGSELCTIQTHVPFILKPPLHCARRVSSLATIGTHIDVLPTVLDLIEAPAPVGVDGKSLFRKARNFAICAARNETRDPLGFYIISGAHKGWFSFPPRTASILTERLLFLDKITDLRDQPVEFAPNSLEGREFFLKHLSPGLTNLFNNVEL